MALAKMNARSFCNCSLARLEAGSTPRHCRTAQCLAGGEGAEALPEGVGGVKQHHNGDNHDWNLWTLHQEPGHRGAHRPCCFWAHQPRRRPGTPPPGIPSCWCTGFSVLTRYWASTTSMAFPMRFAKAAPRCMWRRCPQPTAPRCGGEQLLAQVKNIPGPVGGPARSTLIGHSHGGPTIRYVAGVAPQLVASATSVAGVNQGLSRGRHRARRGACRVGQRNGSEHRRHRAGRHDQPALWRHRLATDAHGSAGFPHHPRAPPSSTRNFLKASRRTAATVLNWSAACATTHGPGTKTATNLLDPSDAFLVTLGWTFGEANDGLVSACSSRLGKHLGDYRQNHLDEVKPDGGATRLVLCRPCHAVPPARQPPAKSGFVKGMRA